MENKYRNLTEKTQIKAINKTMENKWKEFEKTQIKDLNKNILKNELWINILREQNIELQNTINQNNDKIWNLVNNLTMMELTLKNKEHENK